MRITSLAAMVILSANVAFAHDIDVQKTPLKPIEQSLGALINEGYPHMTFAPNGNVFLMNNRGQTIVCELSGDFKTEILSACFELGE